MAVQDLKPHQVTGSPHALRVVAEVARQTVDIIPMNTVEALLLAQTHVLCIELAAALERIKTLEDSHGVADAE